MAKIIATLKDLKVQRVVVSIMFSFNLQAMVFFFSSKITRILEDDSELPKTSPISGLHCSSNIRGDVFLRADKHSLRYKECGY